MYRIFILLIIITAQGSLTIILVLFPDAYDILLKFPVMLNCCCLLMCDVLVIFDFIQVFYRQNHSASPE